MPGGVLGPVACLTEPMREPLETRVGYSPMTRKGTEAQMGE